MISFVLDPAPTVFRAAFSTWAMLWGFRLAWHVHRRNRQGAEDSRYRAWRKAWGRTPNPGGQRHGCSWPEQEFSYSTFFLKV
ncbi:MAG: hypothetical protein COV99_10790 [Bacteroidetes bacterium CG12_big_fil_rev_8_21_14_0_65_60_17]|nr:MAG: hypothetical protein COV99_10790 [Bacteroidetes bacterium CG12_big_fil_rev_8_21_14_0_65_60_17]